MVKKLSCYCSFKSFLLDGRASGFPAWLWWAEVEWTEHLRLYKIQGQTGVRTLATSTWENNVQCCESGIFSDQDRTFQVVSDPYLDPDSVSDST